MITNCYNVKLKDRLILLLKIKAFMHAFTYHRTIDLVINKTRIYIDLPW